MAAMITSRASGTTPPIGSAPAAAPRVRGRARRTRPAAWRIALLTAVVTLWAAGSAQTFSADRFLEECLRFEAGGDLTTARQSCLNALEVDAQRVDAQLALGRIEFGLGELGAAESRLLRVRPRLEGPEVDVLLAELLLAAERVEEIDTYLISARGRLARFPDVTLAGRLAFVEGQVAMARGELDAALDAYARAIDADGLERRYRLADAELRYRLGDTRGAELQLREYERVSGDERDPAVKALLGRIAWVEGRAEEAVGQLETALALRDLRDSLGQAADLRVLAVLYYGQGDLQRGGLALREATRRGNLLAEVDGNTMLWLLVLAVLLAMHLIGESRRGDVMAAQEEGPRRWTLGQAYGLLLAAALIGLAAAIVYGVVVYDNLLALLTPQQQHEARSVYLIAFGLVTSLVAWQRVRALGWKASERLVGPSDGLVGGIILGALVFGVMLGYLVYLPRGGLAGPFFLDLASLTPLRVAALAVVPLAEFYFRGFLRPAVEHRYGVGLSVPIMTLVWALAFATPIVALVPIGFALAEVDRRRPSGLTAVTALWVAWLALAAAAVVSPFVRSLFL